MRTRKNNKNNKNKKYNNNNNNKNNRKTKKTHKKFAGTGPWLNPRLNKIFGLSAPTGGPVKRNAHSDGVELSPMYGTSPKNSNTQLEKEFIQAQREERGENMVFIDFIYNYIDLSYIKNTDDDDFIEQYNFLLKTDLIDIFYKKIITLFEDEEAAKKDYIKLNKIEPGEHRKSITKEIFLDGNTDIEFPEYYESLYKKLMTESKDLIDILIQKPKLLDINCKKDKKWKKIGDNLKNLAETRAYLNAEPGQLPELLGGLTEEGPDLRSFLL